MDDRALIAMQLRPYQQAAIDALWAWWAAGRQRQHPLIVLPTGAGKTVIFSAILQRLFKEYPGQVSALVLAHRKELIEQAAQKLLTVWPDAPLGIYAAALKKKQIRPITIASRDTIAPVIDRCGKFSFVIVDEAHLINQREAGRYREIIAKLTAKNPDLVVVGFTATPYRLGQGRIYGKGKLFADIAYRAQVKDLIAGGYLAPLTSQAGRADARIDTDGIKTTGGDFDQGELAARSTDDAVVEAAIADWQARAQDRRATVFFCVTRLHAAMVAEKLARRGIVCEAIDGETPQEERAYYLNSFARGDFPAIANVGLLTEGWDCPRVDCIALLRPTQSAALYVQMVGRGLRLAEGKTDCLVLDYGGNIARLGPIDEACEPEPNKGKKRAAEKPEPKTCGEWKPADLEGPARWINGCGTENWPSARLCKQCGAPFAGMHSGHDTEAADDDILASGPKIERVEVESVKVHVRLSRQTKQPYLQIDYTAGLMEHYKRNLMLGYPGFAGIRAAREWRELTGQSIVPEDPAEAAGLIERGEVLLRPVVALHINQSSKYKDIVKTEYSTQQPLITAMVNAAEAAA